MKIAIEKAIYYLKITPSYLENPVMSFNYEDIATLNQINEEYYNCIDTRSIFGDGKSVCYQILKTLPQCYDSLLLHNLSCLYIVNRHDFSIELKNTKYDTNKEDRIGIIKIDSVRSEYINPGFWKKLLLGIGFLSGSLIGGYYLKLKIDKI